VADRNGVEADCGDETCDAAGEAVVEGIVVSGKNDADDVDACGNANDGEACDDADDVEACDDADDGDKIDDADGGFDGNEYVGADRDSVDGSGSADDASEITSPKRDVQRNKSTTVVKNNLRMVKDLLTEKIEIEVSRQAEGQRLAVEQIVAEKCLAAGKCQVIGQWEHSDRRKKQRVGQRKEQPEINM